MVEEGRRRAPADVEAVLQGCCRDGARALVTFDAPRVVHEATFSSLGESTVRLLGRTPIDVPPQAGSRCAVQFFGDRSGVFLAHLFSFTEDYTGTPTFGLVTPPDLVQMEGRRTFRVPSVDALGVRLQVRFADGQWRNAELLDLSRGGLRMAPLQTSLPDDDTLVVALDWSGGSVTLTARVVRRSVRDVAVAFLPGAELARPEGLRRLVGSLERAWLRQRRELEVGLR
ncbi:MAG: PilZ domain-containing protein [Myxococcota bacterium]